MPAPAAPPRNGLGTASLVVGALSLPLAFGLWTGVVAGVTALVLGVLHRGRVARGEATDVRRARRGQVLGTLGLLLVAGFLAYGAYYLRGPEGERYRDCAAQARADLAGQELDDALQACGDRLADEREAAGG